MLLLLLGPPILLPLPFGDGDDIRLDRKEVAASCPPPPPFTTLFLGVPIAPDKDGNCDEEEGLGGEGDDKNLLISLSSPPTRRSS